MPRLDACWSHDGPDAWCNFFCRFSFLFTWTLLPSSDDEALKAESSGNKEQEGGWWEKRVSSSNFRVLSPSSS